MPRPTEDYLSIRIFKFRAIFSELTASVQKKHCIDAEVPIDKQGGQFVSQLHVYTRRHAEFNTTHLLLKLNIFSLYNRPMIKRFYYIWSAALSGKSVT